MSALMHYASRTVTLDRAREYPQHEPVAYGKPEGFWVSVAGDDDWPTFCRNEQFGLDRIVVDHVVTLAPDANVLRIETGTDLMLFHEQYAIETDFERRFPNPFRDSWPVDWQAVAAKYDGIIIAPYQWAHRLNLSWYYGWDVASGCIWNLEAIASVAREMAVTS